MFQSLLSWNGLVNRFGPRASVRSPSSMFQSLLSWNGLVNLRPTPATHSYQTGFNPCCRGTAWSTPSDGATGMPAWQGVSILVVVERPGQHGRTAIQVTITKPVSILVVVERPGQPLDCRPRRPSAQVSILVVVERPGQPGWCRGWPRRYGVSILVVVERPGQHRRSHRRPERQSRFQSLLSWNGLVNCHDWVRPAGAGTGFNPCCRGTAWSTPARPRATAGRTCFNPCCRGTAWSTLRHRDAPDRGHGFQSLLSWNGLVNSDQSRP